MNKTLSTLGLLGMFLLLVLVPMGASADVGGPTVTTYNIPFWFTLETNATIASNTSNTLSINMPYTVSPDSVYMSYKLTDSNGTLLSDVSNIKLTVNVNGQTNLTTILLSSGSPAEATIPLSMSGVGNVSNISIVVDNPLSSDVTAHVSITVLDQAQFTVTVQPSTSISLTPGGSASVKVSIKQHGGPSGTLFLTSTLDTSKVTSTVTPSQLATRDGSQLSVTWSFTAQNNAVKGTYHGTLTGTFQPEHIPGVLAGNTTYTFATIAMPIAVEAVGAGIAGFSLGALAGASIGYWAAAIGVIFLFVVFLAVIMGRR